MDFNNINLSSLVAILGSNQGSALLKALSESPSLEHDIFALGKKRKVVSEFGRMVSEDTREADWQAFFEANAWIFGHGLNYVFLDKVGPKLESITTGADFIENGKRADALMRTKAEVSQFVLIEINKNRTDLLNPTEYRRGCWRITDEVAGAVAQTQKTVHEFSKKRQVREQMRDPDGNDLPDFVFSVDPKSYLIVGSLSQLRGNRDKVACFELFRRNVRAPEILTFDELYYRARQMVENMSRGAPT